ncbi:4-phosphoerythronate dehydrogenase [Lentisphaera profundi]|uniref:4-phosphoerythronate dehydrogenase n=1 Tax=Lentisphaera profundi TaxID=1658616 RepID=A0ABY7VU48_9BACT|nr:4-phosphoerythronate dehydrogenase [Lentisphaera profundi]WDE96279.1 4-phosphoerythronate dehydrogenase [Lentisphaera profundi]
MKIVADDRIPYLQGALENFAEVKYIAGAKINTQDMLDADVLITRTRTQVNRELLENSSIKLVVTATIGHDHIDKKYLEERGVIWKNCPGCNSGSVATYIASLLATMMSDHGFQSKGKTFGLVGCGNVGKRVKKVAEALGMKVLINDPPRALAEGKENFCNLETVLNQSDIISIHVPYIRSGEYKTSALFDDSKLSQMKEGAWLVNSSRGGIIVENDLEKYLDDNSINAVLDVWENEPNLDLELMKKCKVISSHIAGYSVDGKANGTSMSVRHIAEFFDLNLKEWQATNLPLEDKKIQVKEGELGLVKAIKEAYDIMDDDKKLRCTAENFEINRGQYEAHRDLANYQFIGDEENCKKLVAMMPEPVIKK